MAVGALTGLPLLDEETNKPRVYNVFQSFPQNTNRSDFDIQTMYGTAQMPVFEWVKSIQTGQRTYNPQDAFEKSLMEEYQELERMGQVPEGYMSAEDILAQQALQGTAGQTGQIIGSNIGQAFTNPYANMPDAYSMGDVGTSIVEGIKNVGRNTPIENVRAVSLNNPYNVVPDSTKNFLDTQGLTDNFTEELFTRDLARQTGNEQVFVRGLKDQTLKQIPKTETYVPTDKFFENQRALAGGDEMALLEGVDATTGLRTVPDSVVNPSMETH